MADIDIAGSIKELMIFDDEIVCAVWDTGWKSCDWLNMQDNSCMLFDEDIIEDLHGFEKCQQCKDAWKDADRVRKVVESGGHFIPGTGDDD